VKGQKDRVLPVIEKLLKLIQQYLAALKPEKYLIEGQNKGEPYSTTSLENIFHKYLGFVIKNVSCQNARVNSTKNRVMKNQKTLSCSFNLNRKNN